MLLAVSCLWWLTVAEGSVTSTLKWNVPRRTCIRACSAEQCENSWLNTVFDLITEHALISGHPPFFFFFFFFLIFILILIIISSDFREGNTSLLYTGLMATRALTLMVHLLGQNLKKDNIKNIYIFFGGPTKFVKWTVH